MKFTTLAISGSLLLLASSSRSIAQVPPFNGGGAFGFDPEVSVVNSGALVDAQVVVSDDLKYVTINARPSLSHLQSLNTFPVLEFHSGGSGGGGAGGGQGGVPLGFVGGAGFIDDEVGAAPGTPMPAQSAASAERAAHATKAPPIPSSPVKTSPSEILKVDPTAANSILRKQGMFLIEPK
jgi:hypothetical protein